MHLICTSFAKQSHQPHIFSIFSVLSPLVFDIYNFFLLLQRNPQFFPFHPSASWPIHQITALLTPPDAHGNQWCRSHHFMPKDPPHLSCEARSCCFLRHCMLSLPENVLSIASCLLFESYCYCLLDVFHLLLNLRLPQIGARFPSSSQADTWHSRPLFRILFHFENIDCMNNMLYWKMKHWRNEIIEQKLKSGPMG